MEQTLSQGNLTVLDQKETERYIQVVFPDTEATRKNALKACRATGIDVDGLRRDVQVFTKWNSHENVRVYTFSKEPLFLNSPKAASRQAGVHGTVPMHMTLKEAGVHAR